MQHQLESFVRALRAADVRVSVAETIEAHAVVAELGYADRELLKDALGLTLAKSVEDKARFSETFDLFFHRELHQAPAPDNDHGSGDNPELEETNDANTGNALADTLLSGDDNRLAAMMEQAAQAIGVDAIRYPTQVSFLARRMLDRMGLSDMERLIAAVRTGQAAGGGGVGNNPDLVAELESQRHRVLRAARGYVQRQFDLYGRNTANELRTEALERAALSAVSRRDHHRMQQIVAKMARKLASRYSHHHKRARRGHLDVRRTLRANMAHDGIPFETIWKQKRISRPKIVAICDVSGSVAASSQFLLMFLYSLNEILSDLRSFAFSSDLISIDDLLGDNAIDDAIPLVLDKIGFLSTDYGRSLATLKEAHGDVFDRRTTVIILGDGRSNNVEPRADILGWIANRSQRVVWLNPEPETFWGTGDSEMLRYRPYCTIAKACRTLKHLERVVDDILRNATRPT